MRLSASALAIVASLCLTATAEASAWPSAGASAMPAAYASAPRGAAAAPAQASAPKGGAAAQALAPTPSAQVQAPAFPARTLDATDGPPALSLARDGGGAVVYTQAGHVFARLERAGVWGEALQMDAALPGPSSGPEVVAADGGRVAAVFLSGGTLYGTVLSAGGRAFTTPQPIAAGAADPALAGSAYGTAYVAFTAPGGAASSVYVARLARTSTTWTLFGQPLNLDPARDAGFDAADAPQLAVATDGEALVAWGERGADGLTHVIARRVSSQGVSDAPQDLTVAGLAGAPALGAGHPTVALEDASDFGWVLFDETFDIGGAPVSRVIARHQYGSLFDPPQAPGSGYGSGGPFALAPATPAPGDGTDAPALSMDGSGDGLAVLESTASHVALAAPLKDPAFAALLPLDAAPDAIAPQPVSAVGGVDPVGGAAWLYAPAATAAPAVRVRSYAYGRFAGPVQTIGAGPATGPLSIAADQAGDVMVAYQQQGRLMVGGIALPPHSFALVAPRGTASRRPRIAWTPSSDPLGIAGYRVVLDGRTIATTTRTSLRPTRPLRPGRHRLQVVAVNRYGVTTATSAHTITVRRRGGTSHRRRRP